MASDSCHFQAHDTSQGSRKLQVTILASEWSSSNGVLSTTIREFAIQLAKHDNYVNVNLFMPKCSETDKKAALKYGISIFTANRLIGFKELDWLSFPPDNLRMDVVVGHGVELGRQAQIICNLWKRKLWKCKWVQVVHSDPEFERNGNMDVIDLCKMADFVVAVGPKLTEAFRKYLSRCKTYEDVFDFTPGVFGDFSFVQQVPDNRKYCSILVFGRGDAEDYELKDFDTVGRSVAALPDTHLVFIGAHETKDMTKTHFKNLRIPANRLMVRPYIEDQEYLEQLFCEADLLLMPSRTEGFGMISLKALSAGLPVIVSKNSGFGEALKSIPFGSMFFIDSEDHSTWKMAIEEVWKKDRKLRLLEIKKVRRYYGQRYSWSQQCKWLIGKMFKLCDGMSDI